MTRFLVRVDDVGRRFGDDPQVGSDSHLLDAEAFVLPFRRAGVPLVLGCVPAWLQPSAMDFLWQQVKGNENVLAVHGWDHVPGKVSVDRMRAGIQLLTRDGIVPSVYIPPFNAYSPQDVDAWGEAGGTVFLGGLDGSDHLLGSLPRQVGVRKVWHAPYRKRLYGLSHDLVSQVVESGAEGDRVEVLTLHVPWEVRARTGWLSHLTALAQSLVGRCVTISEAVKHWSKMSHG